MIWSPALEVLVSHRSWFSAKAFSARGFLAAGLALWVTILPFADTLPMLQTSLARGIIQLELECTPSSAASCELEAVKVCQATPGCDQRAPSQAGRAGFAECGGEESSEPNRPRCCICFYLYDLKCLAEALEGSPPDAPVICVIEAPGHNAPSRHPPPTTPPPQLS